MKSTGEKVALAIAILIIILYIVGAITISVLGILFFKNYALKLKDSITSEKFISVMKEEGFKVTDIKSETQNKDIKEAYKAENGKYTIKFYVLDDEFSAEEFFLDRQTKEDSRISTKKVSMSGRNYSTFTQVKVNKYLFIERINNTIIEVQGSTTHENASKQLLESFGY